MNPLALLGLIPGRLAIELSLVAALAGFVAWAVHHERNVGREQEHKLMQAQIDAEDEARAIAARQAEQAAKVETAERIEAQKEIAHVADLSRAHATTVARILVPAAADRLRERTESIAASCGGTAQDTGAADAIPTAEEAGAVLADMQRRLVDAAGQLAEFADEAAIAGLACQQSYNALIH